MYSICKFSLLVLCSMVHVSYGETYSEYRKRLGEGKELDSSTKTKDEEKPPDWWNSCPNQPAAQSYAFSNEEPLTRFIVSESRLETLIGLSSLAPKKLTTQLITIETGMTLTRRTLSVRDTFRSTSFKSLNPKLASSNMSLALFQPLLMKEIHANTVRCHWNLLKMKRSNRLCFGPIFKNIRELLCKRFNCYPQDRLLLRPWLPIFQSLVVYNSSMAYDLSDEFEAIELFIQMVAATLEAFHHNEDIINGPHLRLVSSLNQCTLELLCSIRLIIGKLNISKVLSRVPMFAPQFRDLLSEARLLYRRGKSVMRPMYRNRMLNFKEKVPRDLIPNMDQVILGEPQENLRAARLASVAFDLEALIAFINL